MNPNLVNSRTSLPFSNSRIKSASRVSSALFESDRGGEEGERRGSAALLLSPKSHHSTHTKLAFNSSNTLAPISASTSSIVFLGPGLLSK